MWNGMRLDAAVRADVQFLRSMKRTGILTVEMKNPVHFQVWVSIVGLVLPVIKRQKVRWTIIELTEADFLVYFDCCM